MVPFRWIAKILIIFGLSLLESTDLISFIFAYLALLTGKKKYNVRVVS